MWISLIDGRARYSEGTDKRIETEWCIYAPVNKAIISSDNGRSPGRRQDITRTNAGLLPIGSLGTNSDI